MTGLVLTLTLALFALAVMQTSYVYAYCLLLRQRHLWQREIVAQPDVAEHTNAESKIALILCLRGTDPGLIDCLTGISGQRLQKFQLHIVVDSMDDPAVAVVNRFFAEHRLTPRLHVVEQPGHRCSLKCSALLVAIENIPLDVETIAFIDADTFPDPNWLGDLIAPLAQADVGAATGNRWFSPTRPTLGGYTRKLWNAAAVVQMSLYNVAWGGSLAIKRTVFTQCNLQQRWGSSFCEDTMLSPLLDEQGYRLVRVPELISVNTESTTLRDSFRWIVRQLLTVRLYHPSWQLVRLHGLGTAIGSLLAPLGMLLLVSCGDRNGFYRLLAAFILFQLWNLLLVWIVEQRNSRIVESRYRDLDGSRQPVHWPFQVLAYLLVQLLQPLACLVASRAKSVQWRGIDYKVDGQQIDLVRYAPYRATDCGRTEFETDSI